MDGILSAFCCFFVRFVTYFALIEIHEFEHDLKTKLADISILLKESEKSSFSMGLKKEVSFDIILGSMLTLRFFVKRPFYDAKLCTLQFKTCKVCLLIASKECVVLNAPFFLC